MTLNKRNSNESQKIFFPPRASRKKWPYISLIIQKWTQNYSLELMVDSIDVARPITIYN